MENNNSYEWEYGCGENCDLFKITIHGRNNEFILLNESDIKELKQDIDNFLRGVKKIHNNRNYTN